MIVHLGRLALARGMSNTGGSIPKSGLESSEGSARSGTASLEAKRRWAWVANFNNGNCNPNEIGNTRVRAVRAGKSSSLCCWLAEVARCRRSQGRRNALSLSLRAPMTTRAASWALFAAVLLYLRARTRF